MSTSLPDPVLGKLYGSLLTEDIIGLTKVGEKVWQCMCLICGRTPAVLRRKVFLSRKGECRCVPTGIKPPVVPGAKLPGGATIIGPGGDAIPRYNDSLWEVRCRCGDAVYVPRGTLSTLLRGSRPRDIMCVDCWYPHKRKKRGGSADMPAKASPNHADFTGKKFGWWRVLNMVATGGTDRYGPRVHGDTRLWRCECFCGNISVLTSLQLNLRRKKNCGCVTISAGYLEPGNDVFTGELKRWHE